MIEFFESVQWDVVVLIVALTALLTLALNR
jgi:hypothetical protein